jgi:hypothetical protein
MAPVALAAETAMRPRRVALLGPSDHVAELVPEGSFAAQVVADGGRSREDRNDLAVAAT